MENQVKKPKVSRFVIAYVSVFIMLAVCGTLAIEKRNVVLPHASLAKNGFVSDLAYYDLPRMTISMSNGTGGGGSSAPRIRFDISLEVASKDIGVVEDYQPRMVDRLSGYLGALKMDQLQRVNSLPWLREEMLKQVNSVGAPVPVHDLLFREFVVM